MTDSVDPLGEPAFIDSLRLPGRPSSAGIPRFKAFNFLRSRFFRQSIPWNHTKLTVSSSSNMS